MSSPTMSSRTKHVSCRYHHAAEVGVNNWDHAIAHIGTHQPSHWLSLGLYKHGRQTAGERVNIMGCKHNPFAILWVSKKLAQANVRTRTESGVRTDFDQAYLRLPVLNCAA
jgi:hypothetical protein